MFKTVAPLAAVLAFTALPSAASTELTDSALDAILTALDDEYRAIAVYSALVDEYGTDTPFTNIMEAEERHAEALINLLDKYDVTVIDNPYLDGTLSIDPLPETLQDAYEAGVEGELLNIAMYEDELLPTVADYPDITRVFTSLLTASATKHLPTFTACAEDGCSSGGGKAAVAQKGKALKTPDGKAVAQSKGAGAVKGQGASKRAQVQRKEKVQERTQTAQRGKGQGGAKKGGKRQGKL